MAILDVTRLDAPDGALLVVFVPPETHVLNSAQRTRLREILIHALIAHGLTGELVAVWEHDGQLQFMGNPHRQEILARTGVAGLRARATHQIALD